METRLDSFEDDAETLFRAFASRHGLLIEKVEQKQVELLMTIPKQKGLSFELTLGLQNGDEVNIGLKELWSYIFPYPSVKAHVEKLLDGIVTGETRLATKRQFGRTVSRTLEYLDGGTWHTGYTEICGFAIPLFKTKIECFSNNM